MTTIYIGLAFGFGWSVVAFFAQLPAEIAAFCERIEAQL